MDIHKKLFQKRAAFSLIVVFTAALLFLTAGVVEVHAAENEVPMTEEKAEVMKFALIAAAAAFGFGAIGAGIAIANVGSAAMGAIGEKPEIAGQALIFIALAEGLVVFGFITALMILGKV
jgi:V/A-type H+-transporting ATPase subunit K